MMVWRVKEIRMEKQQLAEWVQPCRGQISPTMTPSPPYWCTQLCSCPANPTIALVQDWTLGPWDTGSPFGGQELPLFHSFSPLTNAPDMFLGNLAQEGPKTLWLKTLQWRGQNISPRQQNTKIFHQNVKTFHHGRSWSHFWLRAEVGLAWYGAGEKICVTRY